MSPAPAEIVCSLPIYVDGVPMLGKADLDMIPVERIQAIEVYTSAAFTPLWFAGRCGAVVIWTKRPN
jgi:hypothetical protein